MTAPVDAPWAEAAAAMRSGAGLLVAVVLVAFPATAFAQHGAPYTGARVGYLRVETVDAGSLNVGVLGGVYFAPRLAIEGSLDYHTPDFDDYGRTTYALQASVYVYPFTAKHAFRPYGVAGAGFYWNFYEADEGFGLPEDNRTDGGFHAGFGFDVVIGKEGDPSAGGAPDRPICLTVDLRYLFTHDDPGDVESDGLLATLGLKFGF